MKVAIIRIPNGNPRPESKAKKKMVPHDGCTLYRYKSVAGIFNGFEHDTLPEA